MPETQHHFQIEAEADDILPSVPLAELAQGLNRKPFTAEPLSSLLPDHHYDTYAWAMVIDTAACIGCNACVVACQAENNVPVVGPEEIAAAATCIGCASTLTYLPEAGKPRLPAGALHALRARALRAGLSGRGSVHDGEGLNVQVYNRCIGTRFCQSNCPYKVRRFNWFGYADGQEYAEPRREIRHGAAQSRRHRAQPRRHGEVHLLRPAHQPRARRTAEKEDRPIARRRNRHRLPGRLPDPRHQLRRSTTILPPQSTR